MVTMLRLELQRRGITASKLSHSSGINYPILCAIVRGDWRASPKFREAITNALGTDDSTIFFGQNGFAKEVELV